MELQPSSKTAPLVIEQKNKQMTVKGAMAVLQALEFQTCFEGPENILVGVRSKFDWDYTTRFDVLVFVHHNIEILDESRIRSDLEKLPNLIDKYFAYGCPPFGFARVINTLVIYYAKTITPQAISYIRRISDAQFYQITFVAAQDSSSGSSYMLDQHSTPFCCGLVIYPDLRYVAATLTGQHLEETRSSRFWLRVLRALIWFYFLFFIFRISILGSSDPSGTIQNGGTSDLLIVLFLLCGVYLFRFLVAGAFQCLRYRNARHRRINSSNNIEDFSSVV